MTAKHFDVLIIGAGVSGIGAGCNLARHFPGKTYAILERRQDLGGTWDQFRFPGVRMDTDMYTYAYSFRPWREPTMLLNGAELQSYVRETAQAYGVERHIRYGVEATKAEWSSESAHWSVMIWHRETGETETCICNFLIGATGYYHQDAGNKPDFPGESRFRGRIVHPQHWPGDLDYIGKRVVIIGSGATAVTMVPPIARKAAQVTMLQRSPSYVMSMPTTDKLSAWLSRLLPRGWVYGMARCRQIAIMRLTYGVSKRWPRFMRGLLRSGVRRQVGPNVDMRHFDPDYDPWDQRLCMAASGDFFETLRDGKASIETGRIETFTENGIRLQSGRELEADIIVTATGFNLQVLGAMAIEVDGEPIDVSNRLMYKAAMIEGVPNLAMMLGLFNFTWTLKVDIVNDYVRRLLQLIDAKGYAMAVPRDREGCTTQGSILDDLKSNYARRSLHKLPRQGTRQPWIVPPDYVAQRKSLCKEPIDDDILQFFSRDELRIVRERVNAATEAA